ncbi:hypothetical protein RCS94_00655 [Orbaceae bacterium ac157xtp]
MLIVPNSYGALSATSANTIQGHKPGFSGQSGAKKLGFKVGDIYYSEANPVLGGSNTTKDKIVSGTPKLFEPSLRLKDFKVQDLTINDFNVMTDYYDADGDGAANPAFTVIGAVSHQWFDGNGTVITDEAQMIGCGSGLTPLLTLKINLSAQSHSKYGDPRDSDPAGLEQRYQIKAPTSGFCFAKPNGLTWWDSNGSGSQDSGNATPDPTYGGGYNEAQFDPVNGFKASANPKFPTTGFVGAEFTLKMIGNLSDYTFTHNGGTAITLNTTTGKVRLNSKPSGAVTITATKNGTPHTYTFKPTLWVVPKSGQMTYASAKSVCGSESNMATRANLTNSPQNNAPEGWSHFSNYYTRAVSGGVFGEWGYTTRSAYPSSQWTPDWRFYWTCDVHSSGYQFVVTSYNGHVSFSSIGSGGYSGYAVCLG